MQTNARWRVWRVAARHHIPAVHTAKKRGGSGQRSAESQHSIQQRNMPSPVQPERYHYRSYCNMHSGMIVHRFPAQNCKQICTTRFMIKHYLNPHALFRQLTADSTDSSSFPLPLLLTSLLSSLPLLLTSSSVLLSPSLPLPSLSSPHFLCHPSLPLLL